MTMILTVLKTGEWHNGHFLCDYRPKHVQWLAKQFAKFAPKHEFACLSNVNVPDVKVIPLKYNWPGWWSKMELFREDFGKVLYVDLDTVVVSDLTQLLEYDHSFTTWSRPNVNHYLQSGIMAWTGYKANLFETFSSNPDYWMEKCVTRECWGDQGFIGKNLGEEWQEFGKLFPGAVGSYKLDFKCKEPPLNCKIVLFHGKPRPWEVYKQHKFIPSFGQ